MHCTGGSHLVAPTDLAARRPAGARSSDNTERIWPRRATGSWPDVSGRRGAEMVDQRGLLADLSASPRLLVAAL